MTAVGKILVFFNLIFSLVVGAFVVVTYISQTHWAADYKELEQSYEVVNASNAAYQKQIQQSQKDNASTNDDVLNKIASDADLKAKIDAALKDKIGIPPSDSAAEKVDKIKKTLLAALNEVIDQQATIKRLNDDMATAKTTLVTNDAALVAARAESERRQAESVATRARLKTEEDTNLTLVQALGKEHDEKVAMKIKSDSFEQRTKELEKENDKLAHDNQMLVANGGGSLAAVIKRDGPNPPLESVEGLIREVDPSGLVRISIGSDAGLARGNTLEVYRLNTQVPTDSKYLGRMRLIDVRNTEAVGQMIGKPTAPPEPNDTVSSRLTGG